jgi:4-hydroxy-4-methyl-2-oxoglutarate aldolase
MVPTDMVVTVHAKSKSIAFAQEIDRWRKVPTAVVADVSDGACLIDPAIRPLMPPGQQPRLFGFAVTAICEPPDFGAVLHALDHVERGDILVIDAKGQGDNAMIGEILGGHLRRKGAAGIVCDGAVRDVAELAGWTDLPVFTRYITPRGPTGVQLGQVNVPAKIGRRSIDPGDLIIGDDDGLVSLNVEMIRTLIEKAEAKLALEVKWQASLAAGKTIKETFGL